MPKPAYHPNTNKLTIATVGRLVPVKNLTAFLAAIPAILNHDRRIDFLIIGDGPEKHTLFRLSEKLGIESYTTFTGHIADMDSIWPTIDIYVLCSIHEGMSMALLEAMSHGIPVVATPVGGNAEIIHSGKNGILTTDHSPKAIAEACVQILKTDRNKLNSIRRAAFDTVKSRYSSSSNADAYLKLYQALINKSSSLHAT